MEGSPVSAIVTSATLHDSQVAIPLASVTADRITHLYDLMDSAYDVPDIIDHSKALGHNEACDIRERLCTSG